MHGFRGGLSSISQAGQETSFNVRDELVAILGNGHKTRRRPFARGGRRSRTMFGWSTLGLPLLMACHFFHPRVPYSNRSQGPSGR